MNKYFIINTAVVIVAIIIIVLYYIANSVLYNPEKAIARRQGKRGTSLKSLGYYMFNARKAAKFHKNVTLIPMLPYLFLLIGIDYLGIENFITKMLYKLGVIIPFLLIILISNILGILYLRNRESKKIIEKTISVVGMTRDFLTERLEYSLRNGLVFRKSHLALTNEYLICGGIAFPLDFIESFSIRELKTFKEMYILYDEFSKLEINIITTTGKYHNISLGGGDLEMQHLKKLLEYYSNVNNKIGEKYKGLQQ